MYHDINKIKAEIVPYEKAKRQFDLDQMIYDLDSQIELLSAQADVADYLVSAASGVLCGMLDVLWVGEFDLERGRDIASKQVDSFVVKIAKRLGCPADDVASAVRFLEEKFPMASDGNTADFGGGLQHHLRDFAHHPTMVGLLFSLLTQFTYQAYGVGRDGLFLMVDIPEKSRNLIGKTLPEKIFFGTVKWFFHLVSDMAGSSSTAGKSGGTGIPGPLLGLAKELSVLPFFRNMTVGDHTFSQFLSKLFNGTLLGKHDENNKIIWDEVLRFDFRGERGTLLELGREAVPVVANECIVRAFYFIRRFAEELQEKRVHTWAELGTINWERVKPVNNPTLARMLTISTGVFTTIDIGDAMLSQKYVLSINYVGVGRFAIAVGQDVAWCLSVRNLEKVKKMYERIRYYVYTKKDNDIYIDMEETVNTAEKMGLTLEQTEILYNLEYYKTLHDIHVTKLPINENEIQQKKLAWLDEWKTYMTEGFSAFTQQQGAELHWYSIGELLSKIEANQPEQTWFRLLLLEAMLFEPYFPLSVEKDKKGNDIPSRKYNDLHNPLTGYKKNQGDDYLDALFIGPYYTPGYVKRLRKCYEKVLRELNEVLKNTIKAVATTAAITVAVVATAGAFAPSIAVALVGSQFAGLHGAALTSACLAYLGGGAVAVGGLGMAGGTMAIVGGGALLGLGVGAGVGGTVGAIGVMGKRNIILQSAKLIVALREIFLNDEKDVAYAKSVHEAYVAHISRAEKEMVDLRLKADEVNNSEKKEIKSVIKETEEAVSAMKIAHKSMARYISSFETGLAVQ